MAIGFMSFGGMLTGGDEEAVKTELVVELVTDLPVEGLDSQLFLENTKEVN